MHGSDKAAWSFADQWMAIGATFLALAVGLAGQVSVAFLRERARIAQPRRTAALEGGRGFRARWVRIAFDRDGRVTATWAGGASQTIAAGDFAPFVQRLASERPDVILQPQDRSFLRLRALLAERDLDVLYDVSEAGGSAPGALH